MNFLITRPSKLREFASDESNNAIETSLAESALQLRKKIYQSKTGFKLNADNSVSMTFDPAIISEVDCALQMWLNNFEDLIQNRFKDIRPEDNDPIDLRFLKASFAKLKHD